MVFGFLSKRRRQKLLGEPMDPAWRAIIARQCFLHAELDEELRGRHEDLIRLFLAEKTFEGCGGLAIDDRVRLTVASWATLLLLGRSFDRESHEAAIYPRLDSVLVYPTSFRVESEIVEEGGLVTEEDAEMLGESWSTGALVLSWRDIEEDLAHPDDGLNVVLHEFAHQLDDETGDGNGTPQLDTPEQVARWHEVLGAAYEQHWRAVERNEETVIDPYGVENPAEFFAVLTEGYFLWPDALQKEHPELFDVLGEYYRIG